jgi:hypothetical protein
VHNPPQNGVRVKIVTYVPPSDAILNDVFVAEARKYLSENTKQAYASLRALNVPSRAFPGSLVADLPNLVPMLGTIIERLTPNEHMDLTEFLFNPKRTIEYVLALIGANGDIFASHTCSPAGACGPKQFTRGTYIQMRKNYPSAKLPADNIAARRDPLVSTQAAILLVDDILHSLVGEFGKEILSDKYLPEYILAAYNTGTSRVINVIKVAKKTNAADWAEAKGKDCRKPTYRQCLLPETKGYIAKDRFFNTVPWSGEQLTKAN